MWLSLQEKPQQAVVQNSNEAERAEYVAHDLTRVVYGEDGNKIQTLSAKKMTYYESESRAEFVSPLLVLEAKDSNSKGKWRISANSGTLFDNEKLLLEQKVNAVNLIESDYIDRITSEYFRINIKDSTMHTEQPVQMFGDGLKITGSGLVADLNQEKIDLITHAQTKYLRNNP